MESIVQEEEEEEDFRTSFDKTVISFNSQSGTSRSPQKRNFMVARWNVLPEVTNFQRRCFPLASFQDGTVIVL